MTAIPKPGLSAAITPPAPKLGISWLTRDDDEGVFGEELDTDRLTGGLVYTYGPGMTFRGSLGYVNHEADGGAEFDSTHALLGTQIDF